MLKLTPIFVFACVLSCCLPAKASDIFKNKNKLSDIMMIMSPTYALGMTMMAEDYQGTLQLGESVLLSQLASEGIKSLNLETRPNKSDKKSFPSGHAVGAFSGAMFVHKRYGWKPALIPYGMSLVTGWARTEVKAHYWHDVLGGAVLSGLFTWILVDEYLPKGVEVTADTNEARLGFKTSF